MRNHDLSNLVDDTSRILASPLPRRGALLALGRVLTGGLFAALSLRQADSQTTTSLVCKPACGWGRKCCTRSDGGPAFCTSDSRTCCGNTSCSSSQQCCMTDSKGFCASSSDTCCGKTTCTGSTHCCANTVCCRRLQDCVNGRCKSSIV